MRAKNENVAARERDVHGNQAVSTAPDGNICIGHFEGRTVLGQGAFGKVYCVRLTEVAAERAKISDLHESDDNGPCKREWMAMKKLSKCAVVDGDQVNAVLRERNLLAFLDSPFLCNLHYAFQDLDCLYMVMDLCRGGDLHMYIKGEMQSVQIFDEKVRRDPGTTEAAMKFYAAQIMLALEFLHVRNILHHDVKPANVLMQINGYVKLADLGIAQLTPKGFSRKVCGSPAYMSPEMYREKSPHSFGCDWFALGVMLFELLTKTRPFSSEQIRTSADASDEKKSFPTLEQFFTEVEHQLDNFSVQCKDFVRKLVSGNPKRRLGGGGPGKSIKVKRHEWWLSCCPTYLDSIKKHTCSVPFRPSDEAVRKQCDELQRQKGEMLLKFVDGPIETEEECETILFGEKGFEFSQSHRKWVGGGGGMVSVLPSIANLRAAFGHGRASQVRSSQVAYVPTGIGRGRKFGEDGKRVTLGEYGMKISPDGEVHGMRLGARAKILRSRSDMLHHRREIQAGKPLGSGALPMVAS